MLRHSYLSGNVRTNLSVLGGDATVEHTVATLGVPEAEGKNGGGFFFGGGATFTLVDSLAEKNHAFGVVVEDAHGSIERTLIRDMTPSPGDSVALGVQIGFDKASNRPAHVAMRRVRVDRCPQVGVLVMGGEAEASELAVLDVAPLDGVFGDGIALETNGSTMDPLVANLSLERSLVLRAARSALTVFGADVKVRSTRLGCSSVDLNFDRGYALDPPLARDVNIDADDTSACGCETAVTCHAQSASLAPVR